MRAGLARQSTPITLYAGWFDIFARGQLAEAATLLAGSRETRLVVGPWHHAAGAGPRMRDTLRFFDRVLRGGPGNSDPRPVRVQLYGDDRWWALETWPHPTRPHQLFLTSDGALSEVPPTEEGRLEWTDDPLDPPPVTGGAVLFRGGPRDNAAREARPDVVVLTSAPVEEDLVVLGSPRLTALTSADVPTYDIAVLLCVDDARGVSRNVSDGLQRITGTEGQVSVELWPVGLRLRAGERLRIQISGSLHPLWARNLHTDGDPASATEAVTARQVVLLGPANPAILELPVAYLTDADLAGDGPV